MALTPDMPFQRALVIGCSGAGKSTFARQLGAISGLPVVHIDRLFWERGWRQAPDHIYQERLACVLIQERWVIDGNNSSTFDVRMARADAVFWIDRPRVICIARILSRIVRSYGQVRPDMAEGCPERFDWAFLKWVWGFHAKYDPLAIAAIQHHLLDERTIKLTSDAAAARFLKALDVRSATAGHVHRIPNAS